MCLRFGSDPRASFLGPARVQNRHSSKSVPLATEESAEPSAHGGRDADVAGKPVDRGIWRRVLRWTRNVVIARP